MESRNNEMSNKIINLVMDLVYKIKFYETSASEGIRERLCAESKNLGSLIMSAFWVIENNVKEIIENKRYFLRFEGKIVDLRESVEITYKQLKEYQSEYILNTLILHENTIEKLTHENDLLNITVNDLKNQINKLEDQVKSQNEIISNQAKLGEPILKEGKKHSLFSLKK